MNKKLFAVLVVIVLVVIGVGFYRGWFALSSSSTDPGSKKVNVNLTVDRDKMQEDAQAVQNKTAELTGTATEQAKGAVNLKSDDTSNSSAP